MNQETTRARGLQRQLDELDSRTRALALEALKAWAPELVEAEHQALAHLDDERANIDVPLVEDFCSKARLRYSLHHDVSALGCRDLGQASWSAKWELQQRGIPLPPSMQPNVVREPVPVPWQWLVGTFTQATP